jgi:methoxymalonate biosynthesis protein
MTVKCVIWDLDHTLLSGVYLESGARPPPPDPAIVAVAAQLRDRGIIHAIASRNPPEAAQYAARATGLDFAAAECGWGRKSDAVRRIAAGLGLATDAVAFVDDDLYERAEVSSAVPEALVLSPEDMADAVGWPEFSPAVVTAEARRRGQMYAERRRRLEEARAFAGSRDEFLRYCRTEVTITPATAADAPRLHELSVRTHQFNTAGEAVPEPALRELIGSRAHQVTVVRLSDRFGDDGVVGGCVVELGSGRTWAVTLLMMSCRAMGRGVIQALLAWLARSAGQGGAATLAVPCLVTPRNVPLRLALAAAGFRAGEQASPRDSTAGGSGGSSPRDGTAEGSGWSSPRDGTAGGSGGSSPRDGTAGPPVAVFSRPVTGPPPELPGYVITEATSGVTRP